MDTTVGITNMGHKSDSEQEDGWSQHLEPKLARQLGVSPVDGSQHRVIWPSRGSQIRHELQTNHVWSRHDSEQNRGVGIASRNTRAQMSLGRLSWSAELASWQVHCVG